MPLVELSGIDGSGKSTVIEHLQRCINDSGGSVWERSLRSQSKRILAAVARSRGEAHWSAVYGANEVELAHAFEMVSCFDQQILPLLRYEQVVLTDTYMVRWKAHGIMWGSDAWERLSPIFDPLPNPEVSIHLRIPVDMAMERLMKRRKGDTALTTGGDVLRRYAESFEAALSTAPYDVDVLDATLPIDILCAQAATLVFDRL